MYKLLLLLICLLLIPTSTKEPKVSIVVGNPVMQAGQTLRILCKVPKNPANRWLAYGILDFTQSIRQLDGDNAPIFWYIEMPNVPCDVSEAYCSVQSQGNTPETASQPIHVECAVY